MKNSFLLRKVSAHVVQSDPQKWITWMSASRSQLDQQSNAWNLGICVFTCAIPIVEAMWSVSTRSTCPRVLLYSCTPPALFPFLLEKLASLSLSLASRFEMLLQGEKKKKVHLPLWSNTEPPPQLPKTLPDDSQNLCLLLALPPPPL